MLSSIGEVSNEAARKAYVKLATGCDGESALVHCRPLNLNCIQLVETKKKPKLTNSPKNE